MFSVTTILWNIVVMRGVIHFNCSDISLQLYDISYKIFHTKIEYAKMLPIFICGRNIVPDIQSGYATKTQCYN